MQLNIEFQQEILDFKLSSLKMQRRWRTMELLQLQLVKRSHRSGEPLLLKLNSIDLSIYNLTTSFTIVRSTLFSKHCFLD